MPGTARWASAGTGEFSRTTHGVTYPPVPRLESDRDRGEMYMRVFKGLLWAVAALLMALLAAFAWGRLRPPSTAQKAALDVLQKDTRPAQGRNAYPAMWFVGFDVPADRLDAAYAKDGERVAAWYQSFDPSKSAPPIPGPQADFPALPPLSLQERKALCG